MGGRAKNYEWLTHIGASTKTAASNDHAGYFGEGFKIASLCGYRDFKWNIAMSSADWFLTVTTEKQQIDGNTIDMLAYDVQKVHDKNRSSLSIYPISERDFQLFKTTVLSFYYPQNPLLGEVIWIGKEGAVYKRSQHKYDENLPYTSDFGRKGAVFCSYQLLGSNPFDLVVCIHHYRKMEVKPGRKIIINDRSSYHGMAKTYPSRKKVMNNYGIYVRHTVGEIYLKKGILKKEMFYDALSTYVHELCHMFGGDSSNNFRPGVNICYGDSFGEFRCCKQL